VRIEKLKQTIMNLLKKGKNQIMKTKNNKTNKPSFESIRIITFPQLHKYSVENSKRFNQNVFTEKIEKDFPHIKKLKLVVQKLMFHQHGLKNETPLHIRTSIYCGEDIPTLYQDLTIEQWESLELVSI
jgi:hypothetical protein